MSLSRTAPAPAATASAASASAVPASGTGLPVIGPRVSFDVVTLRAAGHGDEIDELLDPAEQLGLEVGVAGHRAQDALPGGRHLRRPPDGAQHAFLPRLT